MPSLLSLLIIEDNAESLGTWRAEVREFNEGKDPQFLVLEAMNLEEARRILATQKIHFVISDLQIPDAAGGEASEEHGNTLLGEIIDNHPVNAAILSSFIPELDERIRIRIKAYQRGDCENSEILNWLYSNKELAESVDKSLAVIKKYTAQFFYESIWPRWKDNPLITADAAKVTSIIARQTAAYVAEKISIADPSGQPHYPEEFYIYPAIKTDRLGTGDLIQLGDELFVILSPRCDMDRSCPETVLLAKCQKCDATYRSGEWGRYLQATADSRRRERVENLVTQTIDKSEHFIPPFNNNGPWMVCFKSLIIRRNSDETIMIAGRIATVSPQFVPNLVHRFASYIGRIGQPELDVEATFQAITRVGTV